MARKPLDIALRGDEIEGLEVDLRHFLIGQDEAVSRTVESWQMYSAGLNPQGRPISSLLFLGPTGVGKTRLCELLPELLQGSINGLIRVDCAEYQHGHEIAKLVGSPPGYLGHRETHPILGQENLNKYHTPKCPVTFLLFDEIEKASDTLWNLLLGVLDRAQLTLGDNKRVDFSSTIIFMTSNLGSKEIEVSNRGGLGFSPATGSSDAIGISAARKRFTPEFINRLDQIVTFNPLTQDSLRKILDLELHALQMRVMKAAAASRVPAFIFQLSEEAKASVLAEGIDPRYGARYLKRTLDRKILRPIVNLITSRQLTMDSHLKVDLRDGKLEFYKAVGA